MADFDEFPKITTKEILQELRTPQDHTNFFYLYISTSREDENPSTPQNTRAMDKAHKNIRQKVLKPDGWRKVCDNDGKATYRSLYFNTFEKLQDEDDDSQTRRVAQVRKRIESEANEVMLNAGDGVEFKINSLLSRPLRYDE